MVNENTGHKSQWNGMRGRGGTPDPGGDLFFLGEAEDPKLDFRQEKINRKGLRV
jgi:hypothetical protein